jgi:hypothetical protein
VNPCLGVPDLKKLKLEDKKWRFKEKRRAYQTWRPLGLASLITARIHILLVFRQHALDTALSRDENIIVTTEHVIWRPQSYAAAEKRWVVSQAVHPLPHETRLHEMPPMRFQYGTNKVLGV